MCSNTCARDETDALMCEHRKRAHFCFFALTELSLQKVIQCAWTGFSLFLIYFFFPNVHGFHFPSLPVVAGVLSDHRFLFLATCGGEKT